MAVNKAVRMPMKRACAWALKGSLLQVLVLLSLDGANPSNRSFTIVLPGGQQFRWREMD
jgi:hypothetical protein